jgi:hypothetical protein
MRHSDFQKLLYEFARGELDQAEAQEVERHLASCNKCFGEFKVVQEVIRIAPARTNRPSEERSEAFWAEFIEKVEEQTRTQMARPAIVHPIWDEIWSIFAVRRPAVIAVAGSLAMAMIAALLWVSAPVSPQRSEEPVRFVDGLKADSLRLELASYFRKSKTLLVGISNISLESGERIDLTKERQVAHKLIQQARFLDSRAPDERSRELIRALERILLELANMEQKADLPDVDIVRAGIHQENILFKIRMTESEFGLTDDINIR